VKAETEDTEARAAAKMTAFMLYSVLCEKNEYKKREQSVKGGRENSVKQQSTSERE
jgi:hypothetical protein